MPFYLPNTHKSYTEAQLKLCPENFVELSITPMLESIKVIRMLTQVAAFDALLIRIAEKTVPGRNSRSKDRHLLLTHKCTQGAFVLKQNNGKILR